MFPEMSVPKNYKKALKILITSLFSMLQGEGLQIY